MKRKINLAIILVLAVVFAMSGLVACKNDGETKAVTLEKVTETLIVMKVTEAEENASALSALAKLKEDGQIDFKSIDSGYGAYITSINGKEQTATASWMFYTSDEEFSNAEWGTIEYDGMTFASSALGASSLIVKVGEYYIWSFESWA